MALDAEEVAIRARERITEMSEGDVGVTVQHLMSFINDARQGLAELLASENDGQYVYTRTFVSGVANAGVVDLSPLVTDAEPLILESLTDSAPQARVYVDGANYQLRIMPDRDSLRLDPSRVPSCAVEDQNLYVKGKDGKVNTFAATVTISGACVPALASIRKADERKLIDVLASIGLTSAKQMSKRPPAGTPKPATAAA